MKKKWMKHSTEQVYRINSGSSTFFIKDKKN